MIVVIVVIWSITFESAPCSFDLPTIRGVYNTKNPKRAKQRQSIKIWKLNSESEKIGNKEGWVAIPRSWIPNMIRFTGHREILDFHFFNLFFIFLLKLWVASYCDWNSCDIFFLLKGKKRKVRKNYSSIWIPLHR